MQPTAADTRSAAPSSNELLHPSLTSRLRRLWSERRFTHAHYDAFLERVVDAGANVRPLCELAQVDGPVLGLRHDVDERLDAALAFARLEHRLGLRATYFVLHTAQYYADLDAGAVQRNPRVLEPLLELQTLGHEVGWHNDLVTLQCVHGVDARRYLHEELDWLRASGVDVVGTAPHGAYWCHVLRYTNAYFFEETSALDPDFPQHDAVVVGGQTRAVPHASLAEFGLEYDAELCTVDLYASDAFVDASGRRWHPDSLPLDALANGRTIVNTHPCLWDASLAAKGVRLAVRAARRP